MPGNVFLSSSHIRDCEFQFHVTVTSPVRRFILKQVLTITRFCLSLGRINFTRKGWKISVDKASETALARLENIF